MKPQDRDVHFCYAPNSVCSFRARNVIASSRMNRRIIKALNTLNAAGCVEIMNVSDHTQRVAARAARARPDVGLARRVIEPDGTVDGMLHQIEEKALATIAFRHPMAFD